MPKKVAAKKLIGFSQEALAELDRMKKRTRKTQTEIINDLLVGRDRFVPFVEDAICEMMTARNLSRNDAIHELLAEAVTVKKRRNRS